MNSISSSSINTNIVHVAPPAATVSKHPDGESASVQRISRDSAVLEVISPQDTLSVTSSSAQTKDHTPCTSTESNVEAPTKKQNKSKKSPKKLVKKGISLYKEARHSPLTFVKDHAKKGVPAAIALGVGAAVLCGEAFDDECISDIKDLAENAVTKGGGINKNLKFFNQLSEFSGVSADICCGTGGAILAGQGLYKTGNGVVKTIKAVKKKDSHAVLSGLRTTVAGVRKTLNGAVVGTISLEGKPEKAAKFIKKTVLPPLRKAAAALNIGVGIKSIQKGIKAKSKTKVINGALDLAYGSAVVVSIAVGGPVAAAACTGLLAVKTGWSWTKKISRCVRRDQEIQEQRQAERSQRVQNPELPEESNKAGKVPNNSKALPAEQSKKLAKANKAKKAVLKFIAGITSDEKLPKNII
ncbi:MAG: hypothetical protein ACI376_09270 [Candidatus Bruticola sp.]